MRDVLATDGGVAKLHHVGAIRVGQVLEIALVFLEVRRLLAIFFSVIFITLVLFLIISAARRFNFAVYRVFLSRFFLLLGLLLSCLFLFLEQDLLLFLSELFKSLYHQLDVYQLWVSLFVDAQLFI